MSRVFNAAAGLLMVAAALTPVYLGISLVEEARYWQPTMENIMGGAGIGLGCLASGMVSTALAGRFFKNTFKPS